MPASSAKVLFWGPGRGATGYAAGAVESAATLTPAAQDVVSSGKAVEQLATKPSLLKRFSGWMTKSFLPTAARVTGLGGVALALNEVCRSAAAQPGGLECWLYKTSPVAGGPGGTVQWAPNGDAVQFRWNNDLGRWQQRRQAAGSSSGPTGWTNDPVGAWSASRSRAEFPAELEGVWFTYLYIASQGSQYGPTYPSGSAQYYVNNAPNPVPQGFALHTAPNGDSVWARTDQEGVEITHKTGAGADDPSVPNRALTVPADGSWADQSVDTLGEADPDVAAWLAHLVDPDHNEDPTDTRPKVPAIGAREKYAAYAQRLVDLGLNPVEHTASDTSADPDRGPGEVVRVKPSVGTRVSPGGDVDVYRNPDDWPDPDADGGTDPGGGDPNPGTFDFGPFKVPTPCNVFPFGVPCYAVSFVASWGTEREAPHWSFDIYNSRLDVDFSAVDGLAAVIRAAQLVIAPVLMALLFMKLVNGRGLGEDD